MLGGHWEGRGIVLVALGGEGGEALGVLGQEMQ